MMRPTTRHLFLIMLLTMALAGCAPNSPQGANNMGNEAYERGEYAAAVESYLVAQAALPDMPEPYYNAGSAYYRQEDYEAAQLHFQQAIQVANGQLAENAQYNLGNAAYQAQNLPLAIEAYKAALRLNPADEDAKLNLELALREFQRQQEEQQQQQQDEEPTPPPTEDQPDGAEDEQDGESEQEPTQQPTEESSEGEGGQQEQPTIEPTIPPTATPEPDASGDQQQEQPAQNGQPTEQPDEPEQPQAAGAPSDQQLTPEQARQLLAAIGRRTETLQERLQEIYVAPGGPPAQDW